MKTFVVYRKGDLSEGHDENTANAPDEPQFEGVVFSDGTVVIRWCTKVKSVSVFDSFGEMLLVHGHHEYDTELVWTDGFHHDASELRL